MNLKKLLQKQGKLYKNLISNKTIQECNETIEKPAYGNYQISGQEYRALKELEKLLHMKPTIVNEIEFNNSFEISIENNKITYLRISNQALKEIPKEVSNLINLRTLDLSNNQIQKVENLNNLQDLRLLDFSNNPDIDYEGLMNIEKTIRQNCLMLGVLL